MKIMSSLLIILLTVACESKPGKSLIATKSTESERASINVEIESEPYKIVFDKKMVSDYKIEKRDEVTSKALVKSLSEYTTKELQDLPNFKRLIMGIIVPFDISKKSLGNTMISIVNKESKSNDDIDEIMIFAYDDKTDLTNSGGLYTFGKLFWGPKGKTGNVTPKIAKENIRDSYKFEIDIKDKVGKIGKSDLPTKQELDVYNTIMAEENIGMDEDKLNRMVMKKFNINTTKELDAIWLKVAAYKN